LFSILNWVKLLNQRHFTYILFFVLCQILAQGIGYHQVINYSHVSPDFESYFLASKVLGNEENPYLLENLAKVKDADDPPFPYLYTPVAAQIVTPLVSLNFQQAAIIWGYLLVTLYGCCIFLTGVFSVRIAERSNLIPNKNTGKWAVLIASIILGFLFPYVINIQIGQINIFILFLLMIYLFALSEGKTFFAGLLLGFCTIIKIVPAFLLLNHLRSDKKFFMGFATGVMTILAISILLFGFTPWGYFLHALPKFSYGTKVDGLWEISTVYNIAFSGTLARIFHDEAHYILMAGITLGIPVVLYFYKISKYYSMNSLPFFLQIGMAAILMTLFSPIAYVHHIIWLYPFLFLYGLYLVTQQTRFKYLFIAIYCILLIIINIDFPFKFYVWPITAWIPFYLPLNTIGLAMLTLMIILSLKYNKNKLTA
jgi:hypothetical protein